ncbi:MAG: hypothetical protein AAFR18_15875 [Cyanobacteria bacterium J06627_32]
MKVFRLICIALLLLLTGCGVFAKTPPEQAVRLAIAQQLTQTQQTIAENLGTFTANTPSESLKPNFKIEKISIKSREKLTATPLLRHPNLSEVYKVTGTYWATLTEQSSQKAQQDTPFDLLLGTDTAEEDEVQTWYLIQP